MASNRSLVACLTANVNVTCDTASCCRAISVAVIAKEEHSMASLQQGACPFEICCDPLSCSCPTRLDFYTTPRTLLAASEFDPRNLRLWYPPLTATTAVQHDDDRGEAGGPCSAVKPSCGDSSKQDQKLFSWQGSYNHKRVRQSPLLHVFIKLICRDPQY